MGSERRKGRVGRAALFVGGFLLLACSPPDSAFQRCAPGTVADQAAGPNQYALAFRREALKSRRALHQWNVEHLFEALDTERQGRLRDAASLGSPVVALRSWQCGSEERSSGDRALRRVTPGRASPVRTSGCGRR